MMYLRNSYPLYEEIRMNKGQGFTIIECLVFPAIDYSLFKRSTNTESVSPIVSVNRYFGEYGRVHAMIALISYPR